MPVFLIVMPPQDSVNAMATAMHMHQQEEEALKKAQKSLDQQASNSNFVPIGNLSEAENDASSSTPSVPANLTDVEDSSLRNKKKEKAPSKADNRSSFLARPPEVKQSSPFSWGDEEEGENSGSFSSKSQKRANGIFGSLFFIFGQMSRIFLFISPALIAILVVMLLFKPKPSEMYSLLERQENRLNWKMEMCRYSLYYIITVVLYYISPVVFQIFLYLLKIIPNNLPGGIGKSFVAWLDYFFGTKSYWGFVIFTISFHILTINLLVDNNPPLWKDPVTGESFKENPKSNLDFYYKEPPSSSSDTMSSFPNLPPKVSAALDGSKISNLVKTITDGNVVIIHSLTKCLVVFSIFLAIEKSFIQIIGVRFHKVAFADRISELKLKKTYFEDLHYISKVRAGSRNNGLSFKVLTPSIGRGYDVEAGLDLKAIDLTATEKLEKKTISSFSPQTVGFDDKSPEALEAIGKAKSIYLYFSSLKDASECEDITEDAFKPYFREDIYKDVFRLFDMDGSGSISKNELKNLALSLVKEEQAIKTSLRDHGQIVRKLDAILTSIASCISLVISLSFFQYNVGVYLASIGTFMLGFTFIFGGFAKAIFEDLVFLFITHPYDVGDDIMLNGEQSTVVNVDLLTSTFLRWDGQLIFVPTQSLISKEILNIRRSGAQAECFDVSISSTTSVDKVAALRTNLQQQLKESKKDFTGKVVMIGFDVDGDKMRLRLTVEHKTNFQDLETKAQRHNKIKMILRQIVESEGITYYNL